MEQELFGAPSSFRTPMSTKIRLYRRDLAKLQRDIRLSATPGFSSHLGDSRQGIYAAQNDQSVSLTSPSLERSSSHNIEDSVMNYTHSHAYERVWIRKLLLAIVV